MKRIGYACVVVLILAVAVPLVAGDKHKCKASTQDCLDKMNAKLQQKAWLGIETEESGGGHWAVSKVIAGSPAEKAGFKKGDVLLAINGVEMTADNKPAIKKAQHDQGPGSKATYVVKRQGGKVKLKAELGKVPAEMRARWIGEHLVDQHSQVKMASK
jgi:S1-C subfamily serine protease